MMAREQRITCKHCGERIRRALHSWVTYFTGNDKCRASPDRKHHPDN